ncbi:tripartite tricarboxylate transporter permease [Chloroflexota bacterium]
MLDVIAAAPEGLLQALSGVGVLYLLCGTILGFIIGILPGIGGPTALALLIPFSYGLTPHHGMLLMAGAMGSVTFGGAITAILVNVPGSPVNIATCFDGYPLAQKGKAGYAISTSAVASSLGGIFGIVVLILAMPVLRMLLLRFGPPEYFLAIMFGLISIPLFTQGSLIKGLFAGFLGIVLGFIGFDLTTGTLRYTFGSLYLYDGIQLVPMLLGVFAVAEAIQLATTRRSVTPVVTKQNYGDIIAGAKAVFKYKVTFLRSSALATVIGIIPGMGGVIANTFAWITTAQLSPRREYFGKGEIEGIVASEAANNAKDGGSLLPTLAFGIPGSATMAVLLGAFIMYGIAPGPALLSSQLGLTWTIIWGLLFATIVSSLLGALLAPYLAKITMISGSLVAPVIIIVSLIGALATRLSIYDVFVTLIFGVVGYLMTRHGWPKITLVLGFILGSLAEYSFIQSLAISDNGLMIFLQRPISVIIITALILSIVFTQVYIPIKAKRKRMRDVSS